MCPFVLLHTCFFARRDEFLGGRLHLVEGGNAGAVHGKNRRDRQSSVWRDLVTMGLRYFLNQAVCTQDSQLSTDRRRTPALLFEGERGASGNWRVEQFLEVSVPDAPEHELSMIDGFQ